MTEAERNYPHGHCECPGHYPGLKAPCLGPAFYLATRDEKLYRLCSRCVFPGDDKLALITDQTPMNYYMEWDALSVFAYCMEKALDKLGEK